MTPLTRMVLADLLFAAATTTAAKTANIEIITQQQPISDQILSATANTTLATKSVPDLSGRDESDADGIFLGRELSAVYESHGATIISRCTVPKTVALTYDGGPFKYTDTLLDILEEKCVKATFFIVGDSNSKLEDYEEVVKRAYREGHQIASHTWSHTDLSKMNSQQIREEMTDYPNDVNKSLIPIRKAVNSGQTQGHNILMHDIIEKTVTELTPQAIDLIRSKGFKMVTVGECLGKPESVWYKE